MNIREKLQMNIFTDTERQVCTWIDQNMEAAVDLSLRQIAEKTYTSAPTVLRVIQKAGYPGLSSFRKELLIQIEQEKRAEIPVNYSAPFSSTTQSSQLVGRLKSLYEETISRTAARIRTSDLAHVARNMVKAERIFIYAYGDSAICAETFCNRLAKINLYPILAARHNQELQETWNVSRNDFALFLSYSGTSHSLSQCAGILRKNHVPCAMITANENSPIPGAYWDVIYVPAEEKDHVIAGFQSQLSFDFVLSLLYSLIFQSDYKSLKKHKEVIDQAREPVGGKEAKKTSTD